jgi:putative membrane protein
MSKSLLSRLSTAAAVCAVGALAAANVAAVAQTTTMPPPATSTASAARVDPLTRGDRKFIEEAAQGGMAEVEHGKLAAQRATHPQVKQFAERMVADHTKAHDELKTIAGARGVTPPTTVERKHHRQMEKLGKLQAADFDHEYMKQMVDDHKKTVALFEKQAKSGKDGDLKSFAIKTLPTLKEHLAQAQSTYDAVKANKR